MKNVLKAFGLIALVAIIGLSMAACDDDGGGGPPGSGPGSSNPGASNPGNTGSGGTFTLTSIPSEFIGKWAVLVGITGEGISSPAEGSADGNGKMVRILSESVSIPMWNNNRDAKKTKYSGNDRLNFDVYIYAKENDSRHIGFLRLPKEFGGKIQFVNGSATSSWDEGSYIPH